MSENAGPEDLEQPESSDQPGATPGPDTGPGAPASNEDGDSHQVSEARETSLNKDAEGGADTVTDSHG